MFLCSARYTENVFLSSSIEHRIRKVKRLYGFILSNPAMSFVFSDKLLCCVSACMFSAFWTPLQYRFPAVHFREHDLCSSCARWVYEFEPGEKCHASKGTNNNYDSFLWERWSFGEWYHRLWRWWQASKHSPSPSRSFRSQNHDRHDERWPVGSLCRQLAHNLSDGRSPRRWWLQVLC